ncbi:hypothetical protein [Methylomonas fluvii]|uniref:Uncharacterized protein n=1 Tax=Methylomonas fluvii TaxID=1854564 RepID=A0ABR9DA74_9GAMM|nr:hypothetical protein [Methylomonas fluvii]MBD9359666.1 hypothetical protein [Methylomonas fluvii]CAD6872413.1 hypothetical protein [Methylomonas fluvii]
MNTTMIFNFKQPYLPSHQDNQENNMAFVNETLTEQDKAWFASFNFQSEFSREPVPVPRKWTIDHENEAVLIVLEGQGADGYDVPPLFLTLIWKGTVVKIEAYNKGTGNFKTGTEEWWRVTEIRCPKILEVESSTVLQLIQEGLDALGSGHRRDVVKAVHIQLPTPKFA